MSDRFTETADRAKEKAAEFGRSLQNTIDDARAPAADKLESAAGALHAHADRLPGGEKVSHIAHRAAGSMEATAQYVRRNDLESMGSDAIAVVRKYPGKSLLAAVAMGFLVGRVLRSDD